MTEPRWKSYVLLALAVASAILLFFIKPIPQPQNYHQLADTRSFFGIPNTLNVLSNLLFLIVGLQGLVTCIRNRDLNNRVAWLVTFAGVTLVSIGSAYYHWMPNDESLVWDRLPMTIAFMAFLSAILGEYLGEKIGRIVLFPTLLIGVASVVYWHQYNDLRIYAWVVFAPLLIILALLLLYRSVHRHALIGMLVFYIAAKLAEEFDKALYSAFAMNISGHSLKHLLAAAACYWMVVMVRHGTTQASQ
ncbi:MAG: ceramidase domain-containing protein [Steroidobacter sp.]